MIARQWRRFLPRAPRLGIDLFPLRNTLRGYSRGDLSADLSAGFNVALIAFPQAMAYAMVAGLPIQYGIFGAAAAACIAPLFASSRHTILGPTNATAVMLHSAFVATAIARPEESLALLVLMVGALLAVAAALGMANLLTYIPRSVMIGYLAGAVLLICTGQMRHILGLPDLPQFSSFFETLVALLRRLPETRVEPLALAAITLLLHALLQRRLPRWPTIAVTLAVMAALTAALEIALGLDVATLTPIPFGRWPVTMPRIDLGLIAQLAPSASAIAFLAALESSVMAKTLASRTGHRVDMNQELLSLGAANLGGAFLGGLPSSASPTRSSLNRASGARTPIASLFCGILCAVAALSLGPALRFIPQAALAALVVVVAGSIIDPRQIRMALRTTKSDAGVLLVTFAATLFTRLDFAIFLGSAVSIYLYLNKASRPVLVEYAFNDEGELAQIDRHDQRASPHISIVHAEGEFFFGSAELFRDQLQMVCEDPALKVVILRMKNARHLDLTSVIALEDLLLSLRDKGRALIISGATKDVHRVLRNSGFLDLLGRENFFVGSTRNPNLSTRHALLRARQIIGDEKPDVRIFYDPTQRPGKA